jgi:hypothetical protein
MFETLRQRPLLVLNQAARDPLDTPAALQDNIHSRIESTITIGYIADPNWESALQRQLGTSSASVWEGFWPLWSTVVKTLRLQGMAVGPGLSRNWGDHTVPAMTSDGPRPQQRGRSSVKPSPFAVPKPARGRSVISIPSRSLNLWTLPTPKLATT